MARAFAAACVGIALAATLSCLLHPAFADPTDDRRALVVLRVLAYDKHLSDRAPESVRILIVAGKADEGGQARWSEAFEHARRLKINGRTVSILVHRFQKAADLDAALRDLKPAALIACDGLTREIAAGELAKLTQRYKVLSVAQRESDVIAGLAVGIVPGAEGKRDEIVVNLRAAAGEGVKFDAGLLQLARTVGEP
jgi:uncharacterized protein DUF4154